MERLAGEIGVATGQVVRAIVGHTTETMAEHYSVIDASEKHAVQAAVIRLVSAGGSRPPADRAESEPAPERVRDIVRGPPLLRG